MQRLQTFMDWCGSRAGGCEGDAANGCEAARQRRAAAAACGRPCQRRLHPQMGGRCEGSAACLLAGLLEMVASSREGVRNDTNGSCVQRPT
jgi:hypothetical protein